jgi:cytohesin
MRRPRLRDAVGCALLVVLAAAHARAGEVSPRAADRALWLAIRNRDVTAVRAALDAGASPNADFDGFSALMAAAQLAPFAVIDLLLERGADPRAKAAFGHTAVMSAVQAGLDRRPDDVPEPILRRLAAAGADLDARRDDGDTALHLAVAFDLPEVVRALLAVGAHPDPVGPDGRTPLLLAVTRGNLAAASLLLDAGADPDRRDTRRRTALDEATALELPEMIALIARHRGDRPLAIELDAAALLVAARDGDTAQRPCCHRRPGRRSRWRASGEVLAARGGADARGEARAAWRDGLELARASGAWSSALRLALALARTSATSDEAAADRDAVAQIVASLDPGQESDEVTEVRRLPG